jgi:hypothetical protein
VPEARIVRRIAALVAEEALLALVREAVHVRIVVQQLANNIRARLALAGGAPRRVLRRGGDSLDGRAVHHPMLPVLLLCAKALVH